MHGDEHGLGGPQKISRREAKGGRVLETKHLVRRQRSEQAAQATPATIKPLKASLACIVRSPDKSAAADIGIVIKNRSRN